MESLMTRQFNAAALLAPCLLAVSLANPAMAHCDSMDGPVVKDAEEALAQKDVSPVLKWVPAEDEDTIREAFRMVSEVRGESETAQLADRYFFDTLVRIHRASEGEGFTGIKPAGSVDPAIAAADRALAAGDIDPMAGEIATAVQHAIVERFTAAYETRQAAEHSVEEGREYVAAYVQYTHFVEGVDHLVSQGASHKHRENLEEGH
jgi:Family of unknown function (DUF6448)